MGGIDDIYAYLPQTYLDTASLAEARGWPAAVLTKGLGIKKISIPEISQDSVSLFLNALQGLVDSGTEGSEISKVAAATESPVDISKSMATYAELVLGHRNYVPLEQKQACVAALNGVSDSARSANGDIEAIVAVDIAEYKGVGEGTQGAGAVAVKMGKGRLLKLKDHRGAYTSNDWDFFKPMHDGGDSLISSRYPTVYGHYSNMSYWWHIHQAYDNFKSKNGENSLDDFDLLVFHTPYPKLPQYALAYILMSEKHPETFGKLEEKILDFREDAWKIKKNTEDAAEAYSLIESTAREADRELKTVLKNFMKGEDYQEALEKLKPSLEFPAQTGNLYTGSIFLSLASALVNGEYREGDKVLLLGYGSGASSTIVSGTITGETRRIAEGWDLGKRLAGRKGISFAEYDGVHGRVEPGIIPLDGGWFLEDVHPDGFRDYVRFST